MDVKIITDSACDTPEKYIKEYDIQIIPLNIISGDISYLDGIDLTNEELYTRMKAGEIFKTAQISYQTFMDTFEPYAKEGRPFMYFAFSSGLSGTYQTSALALTDLKEKYPDMKGAVVDTKAVVGGLALYMEDIGKAAKAGADMDELLKLAEDLTKRIRHVFTVDTLTYLQRGGRLSKTSAVVGNLLSIKPVLEIDELGKIEILSKVRGKAKQVKAMMDYLEENNAPKEGGRFFMNNAENDELTERVKEEIEKKYHPESIEISDLAPVVATHTGPGTFTIHFYDQGDVSEKPELEAVVFE